MARHPDGAAAWSVPTTAAARQANISYPALYESADGDRLTLREHRGANQAIVSGFAVLGTALLLTGWAADLEDLSYLGVVLLIFALAARIAAALRNSGRCTLDRIAGELRLTVGWLHRPRRLPLDKVAAVQVLFIGFAFSRHRSHLWYMGVRVFVPRVPFFQLNLLLADGQRVNVMHSEFETSVRETADEIAEFLGVPLIDQAGGAG